jgi:hypothetical protein
VRRTASYNGTCNTLNSWRKEEGDSTEKRYDSDCIKSVHLTNILKGYTNTAENESTTNSSIEPESIYQNGVTIAVTFNKSETTPREGVDAAEDTERNDNGVETDTYSYRPHIFTTSGTKLSLKIDNFDGSDTNCTHDVYIDGAVTGYDNPFGWIGGSVVYFTFDTSLETTGADGVTYEGAWKVSDCGSYSNITQTADSITSTVETLDRK